MGVGLDGGKWVMGEPGGGWWKVGGPVRARSGSSGSSNSNIIQFPYHQFHITIDHRYNIHKKR